MATISLKAYLSRLDTLLTVGNLDEVAHHCRHILVSYPKNLEASHMLGQALVQMGGNLSEARTKLRHVLSVSPDDSAAHAALAEVSESSARFDEALWYLERACEHATENRSYRERLRNLYRLHRNDSSELPEGLPGAVARRQIREGQRVQAIRTLRSALQGEPGRQDLRLLLARTLWDGEKRLEAAETSLDALEALPWCLHANRIVASLWLAELRPSDARAFLERIHDVDPYLSLRLAGNSPPDEHTWTLVELDYRQTQPGQPTLRQLPSTPGPAGDSANWPPRADGYPADITDGSLPDWLQESVTDDVTSDELAWLEGDSSAAPGAGSSQGVLPWEAGQPASPPVAAPAAHAHDEGDELDWLSGPAADSPWHASAETPGPVTAGPFQDPLSDSMQGSGPASGGDPWRSSPAGTAPGLDGSNPRQRQFVFSRLPLWLRVPASGLPSLGRPQDRGQDSA